MNQVLPAIDWNAAAASVLNAVWTIILIPLIREMWSEFSKWAKYRRIDAYTDILKQNVTAAVKDIYETAVKEIKGTDQWTPEKQREVKEMARQKAIQSLTLAGFQILKEAHGNLETIIDSYIETTLYDLKGGAAVGKSK